jgi:hypothetical protein
MKEAMRSIDNSGSYSFSDGHIDQITMFRFDHAEDFAPKLYQQFVGQRVEYAAITKFALNETPFINPIQMLKVLDNRGLIEVERFDPKSRGLSEDHVRAVRFLSGPPPVPVTPTRPQQGVLFGGD